MFLCMKAYKNLCGATNVPVFLFFLNHVTIHGNAVNDLTLGNKSLAGSF